MGTGEWDRIEVLFHEAADLAPADRPAFLDQACGNDHELRRELELLLAADIPDDTLFQKVVDKAFEPLAPESDEPSPLIGQRVGPYSIINLIGKGGMGEVYYAVRQDDFRMFVAIKVLKQGSGMENAHRRFFVERQILAGLQHPNIARLLDGGATVSGSPFLVMEFVEGAPLLEYAALLPQRQRLRLFLPLCQAVQYAHQHRVVHRDIKPGNILVTADGIPKLLDFGIAKLLDPGVLADEPPTAIGGAPMTPDYASPEQIRGERVTPATDVYSLGAVLYELLTGRQVHPPDRNGEVGRIKPRKLSDLNGLDPDLRGVVRKALQSNPCDRYASVEELAQDLERFLQDRPVWAHDQDRLYRCRKFMKRNRLAAAAAITTAVLFSIPLTGLYRWNTHRKLTDSAMRSIAVLPLENLSGDPSQEYFAESMTDALITELARFRSLRVISRTSILTFKGNRRLLPEIARSLRVGTIAEGSVVRSGSRVRIALRLMNAAGERPVWSGSYEGELSNVLALQNQVAVAVADEIHVTLTQADRARTSSAPRLNLAAYDAYLKGKEALSRSSVEEIQRGIRLFQQALAIDPRYALAYAGLAESYITLSGMYLRPREAMPRAKAAAQRALELDPDLAEAHFALGVVQGWYEFAWNPAQREFRRALELSPNNAFAHLWYGQSLISTGHAQEGIDEMRIAHDLDPLSSFVETGLGQIYFLAGQYQSAIRQLRSVTDADAGFAEGHTWLGLAYLYTKQPQIAVGELERARQLDPQQPQPIAYLAYAHAKLGSHEQSELLLRQLTDLSKSRYISGYLFAIVSMGMNRSDAIGWLEKAYEEHDDMLSWLGVDAIFEPLRADSRFSRLIKLVDLVPDSRLQSPPR